MDRETEWVEGRPRSTLVLDERSWDQFMKRVLFEVLVEIEGTTFEAIGEAETMRMLHQVMRNSGIAYANNSRAIFSLNGDDIRSIADVLHILQASIGVGPPTSESMTEDRYEWVGPSDCPWLAAHPGCCRIGEVVMDEAARTINPDFSLNIISMRKEGSSECRYVLARNRRIDDPTSDETSPD